MTTAELISLLTLVAAIVSPGIAALVVFWGIGRKRRREREYEVLHDLIRARGATSGAHRNADIFESALNSIPIVFCKNQMIVNACNAFLDSTDRPDPPEVRTKILVTLLLTICRELGYTSIEESTVKRIANVN